MSESLGLTKQQAKNLMKFISDNISMPVLGAGGGFAPIGTLNYYMGTVAPQGWLICDGTVYNIADYPEFATFIASNYGSTNAFGGDGTTTFAVPDCRGEFARMIGTNSHANQGNGANVGVHQDGTEFPYMQIWTDNQLSYSFKGTDRYINNSDKQISGAGQTGRTLFNSTTDTFTEKPQKVTSRPTNTSWNFIVKATVSGDANGHVYSTDEKIVGTWIDGSTIYEKTYSLQNNYALPTNEWVTISEISLPLNIGLITNCDTISVQTNGVYKTPYWVGISNGQLVLENTRSALSGFGPNGDNILEGYITITYTKTS